ncbi:hypothetical protein HDU76_011104 [Blyttiomyces sp. JEL0837]|nr:hypothetical protein HDU76_011104 [Blyttiomyces sp. JEL0837]
MRVSITLAAIAAFATMVESACAPSQMQTIFTIILENADAANVLKDPYLGTTLPAKGYLLKNMNGVAHPSQPNYIAMIAGDTLGVTNDNNVNLAGAYARKHNPFISMTNIQTNASRCAKIVPATQLDADAAANNLPNYVFYTPNLKNDGHDTSISYASAWLKGFLEPKLTNSVYAKTLFFITYDESASTSPNLIYGVLVGKGIVGAGQTDFNKYDHYSWLATIENTYALGNLGKKDATATKIPVVIGTKPC